MPIDDPQLLAFVNESVRSTADLLAGLLPIPTAVLDAALGQGLPVVLGTTAADLLSPEAWDAAKYAALGAPQEIAGSDSSGRTLLTNHDVIALLRVLVVLKQLMDANAQLGPLVRKIAVNPRA